MIDYDLNPPIRFQFEGDTDAARTRIPQARALMNQLIRRMEGGEVEALNWRVNAADGTFFEIHKYGTQHVALIRCPLDQHSTAADIPETTVIDTPITRDFCILVGSPILVGYSGMGDESIPPSIDVVGRFTETRLMDNYGSPLMPFHSIAQLDTPILWTDGITVSYGGSDYPNRGVYGDYTNSTSSSNGYVTLGQDDEYESLFSRSEILQGIGFPAQEARYRSIQSGVTVTGLVFATWSFLQDLHPWDVFLVPIEVITRTRLQRNTRSADSVVSTGGTYVYKREARTLNVQTEMFDSIGSSQPWEELLGYTSLAAIQVTATSSDFSVRFTPIDPAERVTII